MELRRSTPSVLLRQKWSSVYVLRQLHLQLLFVFLLPSEARLISPPSSFSPLQPRSFWISDNGIYTFGFKPLPPSSSSSSSATQRLYLLCIWRTADPNLTALWWPSLSPDASFSSSLDPSVTDSATLLYSGNGTLQLHLNGSSNGTSAPFWTSSNPTSIYAEMTDTGNLRLLLNNSASVNDTASSSDEPVAWQSFGDSRNSILLGQVLSYDMHSSTLIRSKTNSSSYVPGRFSLVFQFSDSSSIIVDLHGLDAFINLYIYLVASLQISKDFFAIAAEGIGQYNSGQNPTVDQRLTLDDDGNLRVYVWESLRSDNRSTNSSSRQNASSATGSWRQVWEFLSKCRTGSPCGPFGICSDVGGHGINCSCPERYYRARSSHGDWTDGCVADSDIGSQYSYNCTDGNGTASSANPSHNYTSYTVSYLKLPRTDYFYFDLNDILDVDDETKCQNLCLDRCDCLAATYLSGKKLCYIKGSKTGYLMNGVVSDEGHTTFLKVMLPETSSGHGSKLRRWGYIAIPLALIMAGSVMFVVMIYSRRKRRGGRGRKSGESAAAGGAPVRYEYEEIAKATGDFSEKLGEGGFGIVYKGRVRSTNKRMNVENSNDAAAAAAAAAAEAELMEVAVKVLKKAPLQSRSSSGYGRGKRRNAEHEKQFRAEVGTLGKIHHVNLVGLLGYCVEDGEEEEDEVKRSIQRRGRSGGEKKRTRVLVYELVAGGSLDKYLISSSPMNRAPLPWEMRLSIAVGTARGIAYLHHACDPAIIHCDIKPQNVLLDQNFTPKVADFGFAKHLVSRDDSTLIVTQKCGTHGYMAPEWFKGHAITAKIDVFSFGKLLLEIVHGFKLRPQEEEEAVMPLSEWAFRCISQDALLPFGGGEGTHDRWAHQKLLVLKVALWCIQPVPGNRPTMSRVVQLLENVRGSAAGIL